MTKLDSLITLLKLNKGNDDGDGLDVLCVVLSCEPVSCRDCPLDTPENMGILITELEAKNV